MLAFFRRLFAALRPDRQDLLELYDEPRPEVPLSTQRARAAYELARAQPTRP